MCFDGFLDTIVADGFLQGFDAGFRRVAAHKEWIFELDVDANVNCTVSVMEERCRMRFTHIVHGLHLAATGAFTVGEL